MRKSYKLFISVVIFNLDSQAGLPDFIKKKERIEEKCMKIPYCFTKSGSQILKPKPIII